MRARQKRDFIENFLERVKGIEPSSQAWEARILPLNHTRLRPECVGATAGRPAKSSNEFIQPCLLLPNRRDDDNGFANKCHCVAVSRLMAPRNWSSI